MGGLTDSSFLVSPLYRLILLAAVLPSVYFIAMVAGGMRHSYRLSTWAVVIRTVTGWILIMGVYRLMALLIVFTMSDLGAFIDAKTGSNPFIRYYPVVVFLVAFAGFLYPRADFFNVNRTRSKRILLLFICLVPLYLMLGYVLFVKSDLWGLCLRFGFRSSMLAFTISFPVIFYNAPDSCTLICGCAVRCLFRAFKL